VKERRSKISLPLYGYQIFVIFTDSLKASADKLARENEIVKNHEIDDACVGFHIRAPNQSYSFIVLPFRAPIKTIVHEVYHCLCSLMIWIEAKHEEEVVAYHLGYITQCIVDAQKKARKR
jgi:hypothetical protein